MKKLCVRGLYIVSLLWGCSVMSADLVAHFPFDEGFLDITQFSNTVTVVGSPSITSGYIGNACFFDGTNDCLVVSNQFYLLDRRFTIAAWVKTAKTNATVDCGFWGKHREHDNISYAWCYQRGSELVVTMIGNSYGDFQDVRTPLAPCIDDWGHVVVSYDGSNMKLYVNAVLLILSRCSVMRGTCMIC